MSLPTPTDIVGVGEDILTIMWAWPAFCSMLYTVLFDSSMTFGASQSSGKRILKIG